MKAAKCDRCGAFYEMSGTTISLSGWVVGGSLRAGWYPKELDLCKAYLEPLMRLVIGWWADAHPLPGAAKQENDNAD